MLYLYSDKANNSFQYNNFFNFYAKFLSIMTNNNNSIIMIKNNEI